MEPLDKKSEKTQDKYLMEALSVDKDKLKELRKKLAKVDPRSERGTETLFRLVSKNQYTLNTMIDKKSNILISVNALILSIILGTVYGQLGDDPHLIYPVILMLITNIISIAYAIFATRPELRHGESSSANPLFYGNFNDMGEEHYIEKMTSLMYKGDELYKVIAKDTYHLGLTIGKKFDLLRKSFHIFLAGIIVSVFAFILCHVMFGA